MFFALFVSVQRGSNFSCVKKRMMASASCSGPCSSSSECQQPDHLSACIIRKASRLPCAQWRREKAWDQSLYGSFQLRLGSRVIDIDESYSSTGTRVWDTGVLVAKLLEREPELVRGKRVLELGSGTGLLGMAAAIFGAKECVLTELPALLPSLVTSVDKNIKGHLRSNIKIEKFDWNEKEDLQNFKNQKFDLILSTDTLICEQWARGLAKVVLTIVNDTNTRILVASANDRDGVNHFRTTIAPKFNIDTQRPKTSYHPDFKADDIDVWDIHLRGHATCHNFLPPPLSSSSSSSS